MGENTRSRAGPRALPTPPHRLEVGTCQRGVCPQNGATGLGRKKEAIPEEKEIPFKNGKRLLPGSTCSNQNTQSAPVSVWGCAAASPDTRRFCRTDHLPWTQTSQRLSTEAGCSLRFVALGSSPPPAPPGPLPSPRLWQLRGKFQVATIERETSKC